jgi:hypothetical protein
MDPIMLHNTFIHIQSIGAVTEQKLWDSGIHNWDLFTADIQNTLAEVLSWKIDQNEVLWSDIILTPVYLIPGRSAISE